MNVIAFTGTRKGMSTEQLDAVRRTFVKVRAAVLHHGGCMGADREAHHIRGKMRVEIWPSNQEQFAWAIRHAQVIHPVSDPLVRNQRMVDRSDLLVVAPRTTEEVTRSGTWATLRYARKREVPYIICYPDGTIQEEV